MVDDLKAVRELRLKPIAADEEPTTSTDGDEADRRLRRLAFDIHDGPMQSLTAAGFGLQAVQRELAPDRSDLVAQLNQIVADLAAAESTLRGLITSLGQGGKAELESVGTICAGEVGRFRHVCPAQIDLWVSADDYPDSHSQEIAVRAILREALSNVRKHANASTVRVRVDAGPAGIRLEVDDDGRGFDPGNIRKDRIGLVSMRKRLEFLGGELVIESVPGGPTTVAATFPRWGG